VPSSTMRRRCLFWESGVVATMWPLSGAREGEPWAEAYGEASGEGTGMVALRSCSI